MILRAALALAPELQQVARGLLVLVFGLVLFMAPMIGMFSQPWAPWWFADQSAPALPAYQGGAPLDPNVISPVISGRVSDAERYQLARAAGFSQADAILATALSIAENGSGNPSAMSGRNFNGTYDLGLWQINTIWWAQFGGPDALTDPLANARAAFYIYGRQGWCAWSTYEASCGPGHVGSYRAFLDRARAAAQYQPPPNQA